MAVVVRQNSYFHLEYKLALGEAHKILAVLETTEDNDVDNDLKYEAFDYSGTGRSTLYAKVTAETCSKVDAEIKRICKKLTYTKDDLVKLDAITLHVKKGEDHANAVEKLFPVLVDLGFKEGCHFEYGDNNMAVCYKFHLTYKASNVALISYPQIQL